MSIQRQEILIRPVQQHRRSHNFQNQMQPDYSCKSQDRRVERGLGFCGYIFYMFSLILIILTFPISFFMCIYVVTDYEKAVIFRLGHLVSGGAKGPGLFFIMPCIDDIKKVDLRTITFDIPPQEVLTKDSVTISVDAVVYYRIFNPVVSIVNVEDVDRSTRLLAQTTLRNILGTKTFQISWRIAKLSLL